MPFLSCAHDYSLEPLDLYWTVISGAFVNKHFLEVLMLEVSMNDPLNQRAKMWLPTILGLKMKNIYIYELITK